MKTDSAPDFGIFLRKKGGKNANHTFLPFSIFCLSRVDNKLYSTTSNIQFGTATYAVTIDFSYDLYVDLLKLFPKNIVSSLEQIFEGKFKGHKLVELPTQVTVGIKTELADPIMTDQEEYIPFKAIKVFKVE